MAQVHEAIAAVLAAIPAIGKNKKNQQQGFNYRGIDDVYNVMSPLMAENKLVMVPQVLDSTREERTSKNNSILTFVTLRIRYRFFGADGSALEDELCPIVIGEGMDSGDKATNKAMSIAHKYAMFQMFCIATEELADPDAESHSLIPKQSRQSSPPPPVFEPYDLVRVKGKFDSLVTIEDKDRYLKSLAVPQGHPQRMEIAGIYKASVKSLQEPPANEQPDPATADFIAQEAARGEAHA